MTLTRSIIAAVIATVAVDFARAQVPQADYQLQNGAFRARKRDDYYEVQARAASASSLTRSG